MNTEAHFWTKFGKGWWKNSPRAIGLLKKRENLKKGGFDVQGKIIKNECKGRRKIKGN